MNREVMNDTVLSKSAIKHLIEKFGIVDTERFIALMIKEPFDYTEWQRDLYKGMTSKEILRAASDWAKQEDNKV